MSSDVYWRTSMESVENMISIAMNVGDTDWFVVLQWKIIYSPHLANINKDRLKTNIALFEFTNTMNIVQYSIDR